jgi:hypothetical protein
MQSAKLISIPFLDRGKRFPCFAYNPLTTMFPRFQQLQASHARDQTQSEHVDY